jgi:hypothetical protein
VKKAARAPRVASAPARVERGGVWSVRAGAVMLAVLGLIPMANVVTTGVGLPWWTSAVKQWLAWNAVLAVIAIGLARAMGDRVDAMASRVSRLLLGPRPRAFTLIAFAATVLLSLYAGWRLFGWHPAVGDEFSQRWQALLLSQGRLSARAEPNGEFFSTTETLVVGDRWFSQFPMGWPALLALGTRLGVPWLLNPLLAGCAAVAFIQFARAATDERTARTAAVLFAMSPFVIFMAGSQMNHLAALAFIWTALAALPRWTAASDNRSAMRAASVIGLCAGVAATIRPFDAAVVALMIGVVQLRATMTNRWRVRSIALECGLAMVPVALVLLANRATTGAALPFAYDVLNGAEHRPGFHLTPLGFEHTPRRGLYIISAYLMKLDVGLLAWPVPALLVVVATLALQRRVTAWDGLMIAIMAGVLCGYFAYWSESYFLGPRFLLVIAPVFLLYTARFPVVVRERIARPTLRRAVLLLVPMWIVVALAAPPKDGRLYGVRELARLYTMRGQPGPLIADAVTSAGLTKALVFVDDGWHARLTARLRALGMRPLIAEELVAREDACAIQLQLDSAERLPPTVPMPARINRVVQGVMASDRARPLANLPPSDQLALTPGRPLADVCKRELGRVPSLGVSVAEMLPYTPLTANGELSGVVYARDFGPANARLKGRFGDRPWYVARVSGEPRSLAVRLEPIP